MKAWIAGSRARSKAGRPADAAERRPAPEIVEPKPAPMERGRPVEGVVEPRRQARPLTLPSFRPPGNMGQWVMLAVWAGLFKLSADATYAAAGQMMPSYWWAVAVQGALSAVERFHFAGNRNGFTWGALALDTLFTAVGLGLVLLPQFFMTPTYGFLVEMAGGFGAGGFDGFSLGVLALVLGFVIAYSGDKALDLAMGR